MILLFGYAEIVYGRNIPLKVNVLFNPLTTDGVIVHHSVVKGIWSSIHDSASC